MLRPLMEVGGQFRRPLSPWGERQSEGVFSPPCEALRRIRRHSKIQPLRHRKSFTIVAAIIIEAASRPHRGREILAVDGYAGGFFDARQILGEIVLGDLCR